MIARSRAFDATLSEAMRRFIEQWYEAVKPLLVLRAERVMHGKAGPVSHDGTGMFAGLTTPFEATRYHSLVLDPQAVPLCLAVNATAADATIQGVRHRTLPIHGVQFHPESIATEHGHQLFANFLALTAA